LLKNDINADLIALSRAGLGEFHLGLADGSILESSRIVRRVPGRRIVCFGQWRGQAVYAKIFLGKSGYRYAERDLQGVKLLEQAKVNTPAVLYHGADVDQHAKILIFAAVAQSQNAEDIWQTLKDGQRFLLAQSLVREVAYHHNAGILQTDLYLKNFLVQGEKIYTIDGDAVKRLPNIFTDKCALRNLAVLMSKFDVLECETWCHALFATYLSARKKQLSIDERSLKHNIWSHRQAVVKGYADKKVFRQCTDVSVSRTFKRFLAVSSKFYHPQLLDALIDPDALLESANSQKLKSGNTCTVALTKIGADEIVVKRYNIKSFLHALGRAFRVSRAAKSWANAHRLQMYRILTAPPIALLECRFGIVRRHAYLLAENIAEPDVAEYFSAGDRSAESWADKKNAARNIASMFYKLNLLKITHGDFKATNIKIVGNEPLLIDLDSMREYRYRWMFERQHIRDIRRFMRNWQHQPKVRQLLLDAFNDIYKDARLLTLSGVATR